jgi:hypothetical protein
MIKYDKFTIFTLKDWDTYQAAIRFISRNI